MQEEMRGREWGAYQKAAAKMREKQSIISTSRKLQPGLIEQWTQSKNHNEQERKYRCQKNNGVEILRWKTIRLRILSHSAYSKNATQVWINSKSFFWGLTQFFLSNLDVFQIFRKKDANKSHYIRGIHVKSDGLKIFNFWFWFSFNKLKY